MEFSDSLLNHAVFFMVSFFMFGSLIGSFLNVVIYRWPREQSFVTPRSKCPQCGAPIPFYYNIPIFSWLMLLGKADCCGARISIRYPLVEFLTGASFAFTYYKFGWSFSTVEYCLFLGMAIPCFFIDLEHYLLPDIFTLPGIALGFVGSFFSPVRTPVSSFFGIAVWGGLLWFISWFYEKYRHKEGMGFGDVKLIAWLGALGGFSAGPFILWVSGLTGAIVGVYLIVFKGKTKNTALPFGPFLITAGLCYLYFINDLKNLFPSFAGFWF